MKNNIIFNNDLKVSIYKTIIYFDLFNYPLTAYELWQYLPSKSDFITCKKALEELEKEKKIIRKTSFYYLKNRDKNLKHRNKRYHFSNRKIEIAQKMVRLFSFLPWVKFVALSNLIGRHNLRDGSDIDLFIITSKNRIWISRFFCAGIMKLLNKRPNKKTKRDKICLSFYVDQENLNLEKLALEGGKDFYFYYWLAGLYPLYDRGGYHYYLIKENQWIEKYLPNIELFLSNQSYSPNLNLSKGKNIVSNFNRAIFDYIEKVSANIQKRIMPKNLKEIANLDSRVVIKKGVLKLYLIDRRKEFEEKYQKQIDKFLKEA